jgi:branched-chain amino acid transport system permease protein
VILFVALLVDGALAGAIYALIALAFVVVYKASGVANFALGEWMMLGAGLVAAGVHAQRLDLTEAVLVACAGMTAFAFAFNRLVLRRLVGRPPIALIMVTLGLGSLIRGAVPLALGGVPGKVTLGLPPDPLMPYGLPIATEKLVAGVAAAATIVLVTWFFNRSRVGLALRAMASDPQVAMAVGIDLQRYLTIAWAVAGVIAVIAGTLWSVVAGGGFGVVLVGLKVFPVVIIGGLDSIPGTIVGAILIGVLESLGTFYVDPLLGGGFGNVASYLALIAMLFVRPFGLFGRADVARV